MLDPAGWQSWHCTGKHYFSIVLMDLLNSWVLTCVFQWIKVSGATNQASGRGHVGTGGVGRSFLMVCSPDTWNWSFKPNLLLLRPRTHSHLSVTRTRTSNHTCLPLHAHTQAHSTAITPWDTHTHRHTLPASSPLCFDRSVTFTQLNELSNRTIPQPLHYRGISILQHLILPVHSSPTPLMQPWPGGP